MNETPPRSGTVPILRCVSEAYRFMGGNWLRFLPAALVVAFISTTSSLLSTGPVLQMGFSLISVLAGVSYAAAIIRKVIFDDYSGATGLSLGVDEFRLFAATGIIVLILLPAFFIVFMIGAGILTSRLGMTEGELELLSQDPEAMRAALGSVMSPGDVWLALLLAVPLIWFAARFFLVNPGTVGEAKLTIVQAWRWSRGNVWRIVLAVLCAAAPIVIFNGLLLSGGFGVVDQSPITAIAMLGSTTTISALLRIPLIALSAILYMGLRPATPD